jgi:hypothetical protein
MQHDQFGYSKAEMALMALPGPILQVLLLAPLIGWLTDNTARVRVWHALVAGALGGTLFAGLVANFYHTPWRELPSLPWLVGLGVPLNVVTLAILAIAFKLVHPWLRIDQPRVTLVVVTVALQIVQAAAVWFYVVVIAQRQPPVGIWFLISTCSGVFAQAMVLVVWVLAFDFVSRDRLGTVSAGMSLVHGIARFTLQMIAAFASHYTPRWFATGTSTDYTATYLVQCVVGMGALVVTLWFARAVREGRIAPVVA